MEGNTGGVWNAITMRRLCDEAFIDLESLYRARYMDGRNKECGMAGVRHGSISNGLLRTVGLILLGFCWLLVRWLFHSSNLRAHHDATVYEFMAAAAGFLCFSTGAALTTLGTHIFDEVEISARWAQRPMSPGGNPNPPQPIYLLARDDDVLAAFPNADFTKAGIWRASGKPKAGKRGGWK